jgi:hypothetical protein
MENEARILFLRFVAPTVKTKRAAKAISVPKELLMGRRQQYRTGFEITARSSPFHFAGMAMFELKGAIHQQR